MLDGDSSHGPALAVLDCYNQSKTSGNTLEAHAEHAPLVLRLPELQDKSVYQRITMLTSIGTQDSRLAPPGAAFYIDYSRRVIVVILSTGSSGDVESEDWTSYHLVVPLQAILSRIPRKTDPEATGAHTARPYTAGPLVVPWAVWGTDTRYMDMPPEDICDSRYVVVTEVPAEDGTTKSVAVVYDFASAASLKDDRRLIEERGDASVSFTLPEPLPMPAALGESVVGTAPCRRVVSNVAVGEDEGLRIWDDGLMVYDLRHETEE